MTAPDIMDLSRCTTATECFSFLERCYHDDFALLVSIINEVFYKRWYWESQGKFNFNQNYEINVEDVRVEIELGRTSVACYHLIQRMCRYDIFLPLSPIAAFYHVIVFGIASGPARVQYWEDFIDNQLDFFIDNFQIYLEQISYASHYQSLADRLQRLSYLLHGLEHRSSEKVDKYRALVKLHAI